MIDPSIAELRLLLTSLFLFAVPAFSNTESEASLSELLEEAVYLQEAKGDIEGAIEILERIVSTDTINRPLAAEAQYRLAVCKLEYGQTVNAVMEFENLVANYPNQTKWVEAALDHLPKEFSPEFTPWPIGERSVYHWYLPNGDFVGFQISTIRESGEEGIPTITVSNNSIMRGNRAILETEFDEATFRPIRNTMDVGSMGKTTSVYSEGKVDTHYTKNDNHKTSKLDSKVLDNEQAILFFRQLPPEIGFKSHLKIYSAMIAQPIFIEIEINAIEDIETAIGVFEAYGVEIAIMGTEQTLWISTGDDRRVVKMEAGGAQGRLISYDVVEKDSTIQYPSEEFGYTLDVPINFHVINQRTTGISNVRDGHFVTIASPSAKVSCDLQRKEEKLELTDKMEALAESARISLEADRDELKDFELIQDITDVSINGNPAKFFIGKHIRNETEERRFYRGVMRDGDNVFIFTARADSEKFETYHTTFESIFSSIQLTH